MNRIAKVYMRQAILIMLLAATLSSCSALIGKPGKDGIDGTAFIKYTWLYGPFYYSSGDPGIPSTYLINGNYYKTSPGTYSFSYQSWDGSIWSGSYTIAINKGTLGEQGGFFHDGADGQDGADLWYELTCYSIGPSFYKWTYQKDVSRSPDASQDAYASQYQRERAHRQSFNP